MTVGIKQPDSRRNEGLRVAVCFPEERIITPACGHYSEYSVYYSVYRDFQLMIDKKLHKIVLQT